MTREAARGFLLDTNILSELRRPRRDANVVAFVAAQREDALFVSDVTFAEIRYGIEQVADPQRRAVAAWLTNTLRPLFIGRVLPVSENVLVRWRLTIEEARRRGHTSSQPDLLIAATAAEAGLIAVTRDTSISSRRASPCSTRGRGGMSAAMVWRRR